MLSRLGGSTSWMYFEFIAMCEVRHHQSFNNCSQRSTTLSRLLTRFSVQELGIIPVIGLDFQSGDLQDTVDIVEYGPLHNRSVAHPFLLAAFHSKFIGEQ